MEGTCDAFEYIRLGLGIKDEDRLSLLSLWSVRAVERDLTMLFALAVSGAPTERAGIATYLRRERGAPGAGYFVTHELSSRRVNPLGLEIICAE